MGNDVGYWAWHWEIGRHKRKAVLEREWLCGTGTNIRTSEEIWKPGRTSQMAPKKSTQSQGKGMNGRVLFYSILLTLQYGAQPLISKRFIRFLSPFPFLFFSFFFFFFFLIFTLTNSFLIVFIFVICCCFLLDSRCSFNWSYHCRPLIFLSFFFLKSWTWICFVIFWVKRRKWLKTARK